MSFLFWGVVIFIGPDSKKSIHLEVEPPLLVFSYISINLMGPQKPSQPAIIQAMPQKKYTAGSTNIAVAGKWGPRIVKM